MQMIALNATSHEKALLHLSGPHAIEIIGIEVRPAKPNEARPVNPNDQSIAVRLFRDEDATVATLNLSRAAAQLLNRLLAVAIE
jgi:hypothetical protein